MARLAVFDVDGTLLPSTSLERQFVLHGLKSGILPIRNMIFFFARALRYLLQGNLEDAFKSNKSYLRNLPVEMVERESSRIFGESIAQKLSRDGIEMMNSCKERDFKILVMSGAPNFLTCHLSSVCPQDFVISAKLEILEDKLTGKIAGPHPYGARKKELLIQMKEKLEIDFATSIVFADHHADAYHMELFGNVMAVNPTRKLLRLARKRDWEIQYWR
jgi:putative phosphoserine phosphatase/1-acylglycerol-3-phosphate O-acyltransferase